MSKKLNEKQVLKKLGIKDFRHLTKEKVITMASMLDQMDPEVAKKAIEQFPNFSDTVKEMLKDYKEELDKSLSSNEESVMSVYSSCDAIISSLQEMLKEPDLSFEEKKYVIDQLLEITKYKGEKDTENKHFLIALSLIAGGVIAFTSGILASALGGDVKSGTNEQDDGDEF